MQPPSNPATPMSPAQLQEGFARLSRGRFFSETSLDMTLSLLTEAAGQMSGVERTSIWALTDNRRELRCLELYELSRGRHSSGGVFRADDSPAYFRALASEESIVADNPYLHPSTAEFGGDYLPSHGVMALLDTPIHIRGELQGVFRLEQVAARQPWTTAHRLFAQAVANLVTLALVEHEAAEARRQLQEAGERLRAVFDGSRDALLLIDPVAGIVLDGNRQAERLFGYSHLELIGKQAHQLHATASDEEGAGSFRRLMAGQAGGVVRTAILRRDGAPVPVEVFSEMADASGGRRLVLGVFRVV